MKWAKKPDLQRCGEDEEELSRHVQRVPKHNCSGGIGGGCGGRRSLQRRPLTWLPHGPANPHPGWREQTQSQALIGSCKPPLATEPPVLCICFSGLPRPKPRWAQDNCPSSPRSLSVTLPKPHGSHFHAERGCTGQVPGRRACPKILFLFF